MKKLSKILFLGVVAISWCGSVSASEGDPSELAQTRYQEQGASTGFKKYIADELVSTSLYERSLALETQVQKEAKRVDQRTSHAQELVGRGYHNSAVKSGERFSGFTEVVQNFVTRRLKKRWKRSAGRVSRAVMAESARYKMDPIFLLAVIENESNFDPLARGTQGEIGLMQLMPATAKWVAKENNLHFRAPAQLKDPVFNIQLGAAYLSYLREQFDHQSNLYLAAYNMGSKNVLRNLARRVIPKRYSSQVMHRYLRYYEQLKTRNT